jgi:hypothetical protein
MDRRTVLKGASASAALIVCETVAPAAAKVIVPTMSCGCPRIHEIHYGHTCTVHDEAGKRWDSYTIDEIAAAGRSDVEFQTAGTDWSCYCDRCDKFTDNMPPPGTKMIWRKTSYEYDEWECLCEHAEREQWLHDVTTDWIAMAKESGCA